MKVIPLAQTDRPKNRQQTRPQTRTRKRPNRHRQRRPRKRQDAQQREHEPRAGHAHRQRVAPREHAYRRIEARPHSTTSSSPVIFVVARARPEAREGVHLVDEHAPVDGTEVVRPVLEEREELRLGGLQERRAGGVVPGRV